MNIQPRLVVAALVAVVLTVGSGYHAGTIANRWGPAPNLESLGERVRAIPANFDKWVLQQSDELEPLVVRMLMATGWAVRKYQNSETDARIAASVIAGPAGPISVHDPDVCYSSSGYRVERSPFREKFTLSSGEEVTLWATVMKSAEVGGGQIKVVWGYSDGSGWKAPDAPRFTFGGKPFLLKAQIVHELTNRTEQDQKSLESFVGGYLPIVDAAVFPATAEGSEIPATKD